MSLSQSVVLRAVALGVGASLLMDAWNYFLNRAFGIPSLNYCLLGRWLLHIPAGTFRHSSIVAAPQKRLECAAGWVAHYSIGIAFAVVFVTILPDTWLSQPTLAPALLFGLGTVVFPLFLLQPSLGLGIASAKTANPTQARLKSIGTHLVFGVGLYLCAVALARWPAA
jgi:hypothetical protein